MARAASTSLGSWWQRPRNLEAGLRARQTQKGGEAFREMATVKMHIEHIIAKPEF
jgi:hypothetical protein